MRAMERLLSLGCFLSFRSTLALSCPMKMSQTAESHVQYAMYTAGLGHSAFLLQGDPLHSIWEGFTSGLLCMNSLDHSVPPDVQLTAQHPPGWVSSPQVPTQTPSCMPPWYQHFFFRVCSLSLCAGGLPWGGEPRKTKELNSGFAAGDLLLHSLHICMLLN